MSGRVKAALLLGLVLLVLGLPASAMAVSSQGFYGEGGNVYDDWDVCRTDGVGEDGFFQISERGFRPVIAAESLGENAAEAYVLGREIADRYPDREQCAEQVFAYARDRVRYMSDESQFGFGEFAQNADELAAEVASEGVAYGDCEDYAVLLAVMYLGAGIRSAVVLTSGHAAALVHLPGYDGANRVLTVGGESGWIWAEATAGNNPLGWMPEAHMRSGLLAYELEDEGLGWTEPSGKPEVAVVKREPGTGFRVSPFFIVVGVMALLSMVRGVGRRRV